jgi:putative membrane protein
MHNINNHLEHSSLHEIHQGDGLVTQLILTTPFFLALVIYIAAFFVTKSKKKSWPFYRVVLWILGITCALAAVSGPLAARTHLDFTAHMLGHLLLGMLAPLLMVAAFPLTLILRSLNVRLARSLTRILKSRQIRFISHPITASFLNVGGLWVLYTSSLYETMQQNTVLHILVHIHVFLAGYLFTSAIIYMDPQPHRTSYLYRSSILIIATAFHSILSKYIYAHPPIGVPADQAKMGGMLMYYGGDVIDLMLITILCYQWFKDRSPRANEVLYDISK